MMNINDKLYLTLTLEEKIKFMNKFYVPKEVSDYLINKFENLVISVPIYNQGRQEGKILDLMFDGLLEGWCFETTEAAIVFLNDYDYIERGYIYINEQNPCYYHSWINFKYNDFEYVLDASLNFLCTKENYIKLFNPEVTGLVFSLMVKDELIKQINNKKNVSKISSFRNFLMENNQEYIKKNKDYISIKSTNDVNKPMYRNSSSYKLKTENNKIKKLDAKFYFID